MSVAVGAFSAFVSLFGILWINGGRLRRVERLADLAARFPEGSALRASFDERRDRAAHEWLRRSERRYLLRQRAFIGFALSVANLIAIIISFFVPATAQSLISNIGAVVVLVVLVLTLSAVPEALRLARSREPR